MKTLLKVGLLAGTLFTVATSAFAIVGSDDSNYGMVRQHQDQQQNEGGQTEHKTTVPEPSSLALLGLSLVALALVKRKK